MRGRAFLVSFLLLVLVSPEAATGRQDAARRVTSPREQFGAAIGDDYFLATLTQFEQYWKTLDAESDRMSLVDIGPTQEGRRQWMAIVTAPGNFRLLDRYKDISARLSRAEGLTDRQARRLAAQGKAVVWIDGGLHASETLGAQQLIETVYQLVSRDDEETRRILRDVIVLAVHANPDGHELVANHYMGEPDPQKRSTAGLPRLYQKYAGHDNNRDFYMAALAETVNMNRVLYREWFPQIVYDHHQSGPPGSVMFAPPFRGPMNPAIDPLVASGIELVGGAMHRRFAADGLDGITSREGGTYSTWWNGGLRTTPYFHNQIGILTETFGNPSPRKSPIGPDLWPFRRSIDYSLSANWAVLGAASRHREALLFNVYRMGKNSIARGSRGVRAYVLPSDQPDFPTATTFVNALLNNGITVHRASAAFAAAGRHVPAGSYVVRTRQAFRPHIVDMFEPQDHPDDFTPAGAPIPPYDSAGWTLAYQMGVKFERLLTDVDGPLEVIEGAARIPAGEVKTRPEAAGYVFSHRSNNAYAAANRLLAAGERVYRSAGGAMYVAAGRSTLETLHTAAAELGLTFTGVAAAPAGDALELRPARVGLADRTGGSAPSGWMRWVLERYEFPFEVVASIDLEHADLEGFDVIVLPEDVTPDVRAHPRLTRFVTDGGTLVAVGRATAVSSAFDLPIVNPLAGLTQEKYFVPGSLLRARVDTSLPAAYGLEPDVDMFFDNSPVFRLQAGAAARGVKPIAWFATGAPLRSGWAWGQAHLKDAVVALEAPVGRGRVVLFGPEITFRAQSHGTFKLLFNSIHYAGGRW
ncbi:MAG: peptidase [Acidimicrobiia bacterium]|nr:peptidase [Acidimicrobiia bacterium]